MKLGNYPKTPAERKRYAIDYADWLDTGEVIASWTIVVAPVTTSPLVIDEVSLDLALTTLVFYASGGLHSKTYTATVTATTSGGQVKEDTVLFTVRNL
jgi:hypothetical protein